MTEPTSRPVRLGPFLLEHILARGGMSTVWRATHAEQQVPVAVKVLTAKYVQQGRFHRAFKEELRATAVLNHTNIVTLLDYGRVDRVASEASRGQLPEDAPYLVLELAAGGSLDERARQPSSWRELHAILSSLLSALAHAHARGVIHGDVKPSNVLYRHDPAVDPTVVLTDFGLARALNRSRVQHGLSGTPRYMAPEQFRLDGFSLGPWTDLYSLGCAAYRWLTGSPPFDELGTEALARAHRRDQPPHPMPRFPVPNGLYEWLLGLLEKHPGLRFQRAADAAWALDELQAAPVDSLSVRAPVPLSLDALPLHSTGFVAPDLSLREDSEIEVIVELDNGDLLAPPSSRQPPSAPPIPWTWTDERAIPRSPAPLHEAGIRLWGLRTLPFVGRIQERSSLWRALRKTAQTGRARAVILRGPTGSGKSRLAMWLAERAAEVGAAEQLRAAHNPLGGGGDGITRTIARWAGCDALSGQALVERLEQVLSDDRNPDEGEVRALAALFERETSVDHHVAFRNPVERWVLLRRMLGRLTRQRPLVLWLDDVQWSSESLTFTRWLLRTQSQAAVPVLILATVRDEVLEMRPTEARLLERLGDMPDVSALYLQNLTRENLRELLFAVAPGQDALHKRILHQTRAHPIRAIHHLGDLIHREQVAAEDPELDDLTDPAVDPWSARMNRALQGCKYSAFQAVYYAAVLGREIALPEWTALCEDAEIPFDAELPERLYAHRLAFRTDIGVAFAHALLHERVLAIAAERGHTRSAHLACAKLLERRARRNPREALRYVRHLLAAGADMLALDAALSSAERTVRHADFRIGHELLDVVENVIQRGVLPEEDERVGDAMIVRARLSLRGNHDISRIVGVLDRLEALAPTHGWRRAAAGARRLRSVVADRQGRTNEAEACSRDALKQFRVLHDASGIVGCLSGLGYLARIRGDLRTADRFYSEALSYRDRLRDDPSINDILQGLATVHKLRGNLDLSVRLFTEALEHARETGDRAEAASCSNGLGEVARELGKLEEATDHYRHAADLFRALGSSRQIVPRINMALVLLARRRYDRAQPVLAEALAFLADRKAPHLTAAVHAALLPCAAVDNDWTTWDEHFVLSREQLEQTQIVDPDVAWSFELGAQLAVRCGRQHRARLAYQVSRDQWASLAQRDRVRAVENVLRTLE